jgi:S-DNA-T family DNA segregation ATPase FtsK/SpoIIIE
MRNLGCRPIRERIPTDDGTLRQVRGYRTADLRTAIQAAGTQQRASGQGEVHADDQ